MKGGSARYVIEGLSRTAGSYAEAIECLKKRYHMPPLIYQAHVCTILEAPFLKNGSTPELHHLLYMTQ